MLSSMDFSGKKFFFKYSVHLMDSSDPLIKAISFIEATSVTSVMQAVISL